MNRSNNVLAIQRRHNTSGVLALDEQGKIWLKGLIRKSQEAPQTNGHEVHLTITATDELSTHEDLRHGALASQSLQH